MDFQTHYITPDVKLSRYEGRLFKTEATFDYHMLIWFISGETRIIQADATYVFRSGDVFLIPRNQPTTVITAPTGDTPHQAVAMHLTTTRLRDFYRDKSFSTPVVAVPKVRQFASHPLLESCLTSLLPYFQLEGIFPEEIAALKITEALTVLRRIDPGIDGILGNFEEPGKIDLVDFMEKNFAFNLPLSTFSYLTGRSLATFNRDFRKAFRTTPQRWLTHKRLELAHYQLAEKHRKPVDVYLEAGFENLSHFSFAFRRQYGYPPGSVV
jgi:AraC-like DNA-binding protein